MLDCVWSPLVYRGKFIKVNGQQSNFQDWLWLHSLPLRRSFISNYWVQDFCSLWFPWNGLYDYLLYGQTVIRVRINLVQHTQPSNIASITQRQEKLGSEQAWPLNTHGAQEAGGDIQQLPLTQENKTRWLEEYMQNSNGVTLRCSQIYVSPTWKYQLSERHGKQYHGKICF